MAEGWGRRLRSPAVVDVATRVPLIVMMAFIALAAWGRLGRDWAQAATAGPLRGALAFGQDAAFCAFALAVCVLAVVRLAPLAKAPGWLPRASALTGAFMLTLLARLPRAAGAPPAVELASLALLLAGNGLMVYAVVHLGRSFSILPEARRLVTDGPYGVVRHPLYVAEALVALGSFLIYLNWTAAALCLLQTVLQLGRVHYEESLLRDVFPDYAAYARRVPRFLPRW